jgi:transposase-like protein
MSNKGKDHWFYSPAGAEELRKAHWDENKSVREIAKEHGCNAMLVSRAMDHHGIKKKTKEESYKEAVKKGVVGAPKGHEVSSKARQKISKGLYYHWKDNPEAREAASERLKKRWLDDEITMLAYARDALNSEKLREIKENHQFIRSKSPFVVATENLLEKTFGQVTMREVLYVGRRKVKIDYWFPEHKLAVFMLSPILSIIEDEDDVEEREEDRNALMEDGGTVVWVRYYTKGTSIPAAHEDCAKEVVKLIKDIMRKPRSVGYRFIELTP